MLTLAKREKLFELLMRGIDRDNTVAFDVLSELATGEIDEIEKILFSEEPETTPNQELELCGPQPLHR